MRLDRFLANKGFGTRKEVKKIIRTGIVKVDDQIIKDFSFQLNPEVNIVCVNDEVIQYSEFVYIMLNKPKDVITATSDSMHETVIDLITEYHKGLFPVGRLDIDTEGLLLLTNDGSFAHQVISGKKDIIKVYEVHLAQAFDSSYIIPLQTGLSYGDNEVAKPATVEVIDDFTIHLGITEGKFHQVKRMMHACNNEVLYLKRISIGGLSLNETLAIGEYRYLSKEELNRI